MVLALFQLHCNTWNSLARYDLLFLFLQYVIWSNCRNIQKKKCVEILKEFWYDDFWGFFSYIFWGLCFLEFKNGWKCFMPQWEVFFFWSSKNDFALTYFFSSSKHPKIWKLKKNKKKKKRLLRLWQVKINVTPFISNCLAHLGIPTIQGIIIKCLISLKIS